MAKLSEIQTEIMNDLKVLIKRGKFSNDDIPKAIKDIVPSNLKDLKDLFIDIVDTTPEAVDPRVFKNTVEDFLVDHFKKEIKKIKSDAKEEVKDEKDADKSEKEDEVKAPESDESKAEDSEDGAGDLDFSDDLSGEEEEEESADDMVTEGKKGKKVIKKKGKKVIKKKGKKMLREDAETSIQTLLEAVRSLQK